MTDDPYGPGGPYPRQTSRETGVGPGPLRRESDDDLWDVPEEEEEESGD